MANPKRRKLNKNILIAYQRLMSRGGILCRQSSATEEAMDGGGYLYFDGREGQSMPPKSSLFLIENNLVEPVADGLFADTSQTFRAVERSVFNAFREQWEAPVV